MIVKTQGSQKEAQIQDISTKSNYLLHYDVDYDTTRPEKTIQEFVKDIREMISRFEGNRARIFQIETEIVDMEHFMEIGKFKNVPEGYRLYRKLAELRRERRACKSENDLLQPVYEYFHATEVLNKLSTVQGDCAKIRAAIDQRSYAVRTDVLDEWLEPEKKEPMIGQNLLSSETMEIQQEESVYDDKNGAGDLVARDVLNAVVKEKKYKLAWKAEAQ
jgi:hypothetical protein